MTKTSLTVPVLSHPPSGLGPAADPNSAHSEGDQRGSRALAPRQALALSDRNNGSDTASTSLAAARNTDGTFGTGNPGRPRGSRNRTSQAVQMLLEGEAEALSRKAVEMALAGDTTALRLCLERLCPPRKDAPIRVDLPPMNSARDAAEAVQAVVAAVGRGELTPLEGTSVVALIDVYRRTLELAEIEERVSQLEEAVHGAA